MKQGIRQKLETTLDELEQEFAEFLVAALGRCASGQWGIFGSYDLIAGHKSSPLAEKLKSTDAEKLLDLGEQISALRNRLGAEEFPLCRRFLEYRQLHSSNTLGEPKLAAQFLAELRDR